VNDVKIIGWNGNNDGLQLGFTVRASNAFVRTGEDSLNMWGSAFVILNRDLDATGYNFWVAIANQGGPGVLFQGNATGLYGKSGISGAVSVAEESRGCAAGDASPRKALTADGNSLRSWLAPLRADRLSFRA
jgi:hypothetical protein